MNLNVNYGSGGVLPSDRPPVRTAAIDQQGVAAMQDEQRQRVSSDFRNEVNKTYWSRVALGGAVGVGVSLAAPWALGGILGLFGVTCPPLLAGFLLVAGIGLAIHSVINAIKEKKKLNAELNKANVRMSRVMEQAKSAGFEMGFSVSCAVFAVVGTAAALKNCGQGLKGFNKLATNLADDAAESTAASAGKSLKGATEISEALAGAEGAQIGRLHGAARARAGGNLSKTSTDTTKEAILQSANRQAGHDAAELVKRQEAVKLATGKLDKAMADIRTVQDTIKTVKSGAAGTSKTVEAGGKTFTIEKIAPKTGDPTEIKITIMGRGSRIIGDTKVVRLNSEGNPIKGKSWQKISKLHDTKEAAFKELGKAKEALPGPKTVDVLKGTKAAVKEELKFLDKKTVQQIAKAQNEAEVAQALGREPGEFVGKLESQELWVHIRNLARSQKWYHRYETKGVLMNAWGRSGVTQEMAIGASVSQGLYKASPFVTGLFNTNPDVEQAMRAQELALMQNVHQQTRDASPAQIPHSGFGVNPNNQNFTVLQ